MIDLHALTPFLAAAAAAVAVWSLFPHVLLLLGLNRYNGGTLSADLTPDEKGFEPAEPAGGMIPGG
jgi:hypothetical protein